MDQMSRDEIKLLLEEAVEKGVHETLESLGFDMKNPLDIQRNMIYLDSQRKASEQISTWTRRAVWGAFIAGMISVFGTGLVSGIKSALGLQ